jgi:hypothetical protein
VHENQDGNCRIARAPQGRSRRAAGTLQSVCVVHVVYVYNKSREAYTVRKRIKIGREVSPAFENRRRCGTQSTMRESEWGKSLTAHQSRSAKSAITPSAASLSFAAGIQRTWNSAPYLRSSAPCERWFYNARKRIPRSLYSARNSCEAASSNARVAPIGVLSRLLDTPTATVISVRCSVRFAELTQRAWTRSSLFKRRAARTTRGGLRNHGLHIALPNAYFASLI